MNLLLPFENVSKFYNLVKSGRNAIVSMMVFLCVGLSYGQTTTTVVCADGTLNTTYCYSDNDNTTFTFISDTGFPLRLVFNAGTVENNFDELIVLDTDGVTNLNAGTPYGTAGQLTGITYESTGDTITIGIDSDGSTSCADGLFIPWNFDINCLSCTAPDISFINDGMCETGQLYSIDVVIADLGSSTAITVTDDQGSAPQTATAPGTLTFGTYDPTAVVSFTVETGDLNCDFTSETISCQATGSCEILDAGPDVALDCETECIDLAADYIAIPNRGTEEYLIQGPLCDLPPLTGGTPTNLTIDDRWTNAIPLDFTFNYYGVDYNDIVIGANGQITFDVGLAGGFNGWNIDPADMIPSADASFPLNTIFGAFHDLNPATNPDPTRINYFVTGTAPYRIFVLNFNMVPHFGGACAGITTTQQILLYESLNVIDVNLIDKPSCDGWNDGLAALGLQGNDLTQFSVPEDRNVGAWSATNENWRFVPNGAPINSSTFEWRDAAGTVIGTDAILNVCPTTTTTYTAALVVELPDGSFEEFTDDVVVTKETGCSFFDCNDTTFNEDFGTGTGLVSDPNTTLNLYDGVDQIGANEYIVSNTSAGLNNGWFQDLEDHTEDDTNGRMIFFNPSELPAEAELYRRTLSVEANTEHFFGFWMTTVYDTDTNICPGGGDPSRIIYRVEQLDGTLIEQGTTEEVVNQSDPQWLRFSLGFNSGANTEVQIVFVNDIFVACGNDLAIDDIFLVAEGEAPVIIAPADLEECNEGGGTATFNLEETITELLDGLDAAAHVITFHNSQEDADSGDNPIATPTAYNNTTNPETIFVRVERLDQPNCFSTTSFNLIILDPIVVTSGLPTEAEFCANADFTGLDATPTNAGVDLSTVTYEWMDATGAVVSTDAIYVPTTTGIHTVTVTVPPCSVGVFTVDVIVNPVPDVDLGPDVILCNNESYDIIPNIVGDTTGATFEWSTGATDTTITVEVSGTYTLTVTTADGCIVTDEVTVNISDPVTVNLDQDDIEVCPDFDTTITATASEDGVTYQWFRNDEILSGETNSTYTFNLPAGSTTQTYTVVVTNADGCMGEASTVVNLYTNNEFCRISEGISPNGDGFNDSLDLTFLNNRTGIEKLQIFNRLGKVVYELSNYTNQWSGQTDEGDELPTGTYFYVLILNGDDPVFGQTPTGFVYLNREAN
ncbi:gliding motility-associated C-terminal domain-containing protein [Patiriisocius marinus]|uniref:gliding motility-associated C-terminal domain-containing protein n=1 Tax=Patiriisocius marinus TaxID=1397112 RepID=UPI00232D5675|nr:gliding motility-associated C-terminal domain-containing protein [Patiriisocius marinus]